MAISEYDVKTPESLEECQDFILATMTAIESIWGKLQSGEWPVHVKSQGEYEAWRQTTLSAKGHKQRRLSWLQEFCADNWGCSYQTKRSVLIAIQEREMQMPSFLMDTAKIEKIQEPQTQSIQAIEANKPLRPEMQLSLQSEKRMNGIIQRLKEAREAAGINQTEASEAIGFNSNVVTNWERGTVSPTLLNIFKLCQVYEVESLEILTGERSVSREDLIALSKLFEDGVEYIQTLID